MRFPALFFVSVLILVQGAAWAEPGNKTGAVETIHLRPGQPPLVGLTPELLYRILVAEIAAQKGMFNDAAQGLLAVARETYDSRLALRAFQMAMTGQNLDLGLQAAQLWARLDPDNPEAVAASLALAASSGKTDGLAQTLARRVDAAQGEDQEQAIMQAAAIVSKMEDKHLALAVLDRALSGVQGNSGLAHMALADVAWSANEYQRALAEARLAQQIMPQSQEVAQRVLEYGLRVEPAKVIQDTQEYLLHNPGQRRLQMLLLRRLSERAEYTQAIEQLGLMRQQAPEDFDLLYTEAEVNIHAKRYARARALLNQYIDIQEQRRKALHAGSSDAQAQVSDARMLLSGIAELEGKYNEAIAQLRLIDEPELKFQAQSQEAVLYGKAGEINKARAALLAIQPQDEQQRIQVQLTLASIYRDAGRSDQAVEVLSAADGNIPDSVAIKYDLGMLLLQQGKQRDFEKHMRRIIEIDPDNANALNSLGYTMVEQNRNLDEARDLLERALDLEPDNPYILDSVGWYLFRINDYEAALEFLSRSYEKMPAPDVAAHLGEAMWQVGRKEQARKLWAQALARDPDNETLLATLKRLGVSLP